MSREIQTLLVMAMYMFVVVGIGIYFSKRSRSNTDEYFLGGRSLGPWVAAMSAEASDMSGWLLMGLPGVAYWCGLADAVWTAIGLAIGTYVNWLVTSKRLRSYSIVAGNATTIPDFLSNRFHEKKKVILLVAASFIIIFFTAYAASCFVTCGKLFSTLFDSYYVLWMIIGAVFVLLYTVLGGFLAESVSDFMQAIVMFVALISVLIFGVAKAGGFGAVIDNAKNIDGFFSLTKIANPVLNEAGEQAGGLFGESSPYGILKICSMLAWGLGYFGMPQVLLRFMAIRKSSELRRSRIIAIVWCAISLAVAVFIGIVGRKLLLAEDSLNTASKAENVFIVLSQDFFPTIIAGLVMAGILAATISSSDSYLLIAASAVSKNVFKGVVKKDATDKQVMLLSRIVLIVITIVGAIIALDQDSVIFKIVSFAWAGFGATFGPIVILSLFWKRTTREGAIAGMCAGGAMVFIWKLLISKIGGIFAIYELLPAFIISIAVIVIVSLCTKEPDKEILEEFEKAKNYADDAFING